MEEEREKKDGGKKRSEEKRMDILIELVLPGTLKSISTAVELQPKVPNLLKTNKIQIIYIYIFIK